MIAPPDVALFELPRILDFSFSDIIGVECFESLERFCCHNPITLVQLPHNNGQVQVAVLSEIRCSQNQQWKEA
jgi:hypothetical protein